MKIPNDLSGLNTTTAWDDPPEDEGRTDGRAGGAGIPRRPFPSKPSSPAHVPLPDPDPRELVGAGAGVCI